MSANITLSAAACFLCLPSVFSRRTITAPLSQRSYHLCDYNTAAMATVSFHMRQWFSAGNCLSLDPPPPIKLELEGQKCGAAHRAEGLDTPLPPAWRRRWRCLPRCPIPGCLPAPPEGTKTTPVHKSLAVSVTHHKMLPQDKTFRSKYRV